jgi:hypothetical protein
MPTPPFEEQIGKTGFVLENRIAQQLKAARWTVISNRYYIDDAEETVREIDLVAYQATKLAHFDVYTTLIISCKKSETNAWVLLARDIDLKDPNSDWFPFHVWSNDKSLSHQLGLSGSARRYHDEAHGRGVKDALRTPEVEVFAFQEMNKVSAAPQNDRAIFAAVTSLMKAQAYELGALPQRKKSAAVYQFNLLSVVDADLVRLKFDASGIVSTPIMSEHYIARYIVRKRETFSRIRFLHANAVSDALPDYERLHRANCVWFNAESDAFFKDILQDTTRTNALIEDFRKEVAWSLSWRLERNEQPAIESGSLWISWDAKKTLAKVYAPFGTEGVRMLNEDEIARKRVAKALERIYRYVGDFAFKDDDIPF